MAFKLKNLFILFISFLYLFATSSLDEKHKYLPKKYNKKNTKLPTSSPQNISFALLSFAA